MNTKLNGSGKQDGSLPGHVNLGVLLEYEMCSTMEDNKAVGLTQMRDRKLFRWTKASPDLLILMASRTSLFSLLLYNFVKKRDLQAKSRHSSRLHFRAPGAGPAAATNTSNLCL